MLAARVRTRRGRDGRLGGSYVAAPARIVVVMTPAIAFERS
jgi:hypothetical protein